MSTTLITDYIDRYLTSYEDDMIELEDYIEDIYYIIKDIYYPNITETDIMDKQQTIETALNSYITTNDITYINNLFITIADNELISQIIDIIVNMTRSVTFITELTQQYIDAWVITNSDAEDISYRVRTLYNDKETQNELIMYYRLAQ